MERWLLRTASDNGQSTPALRDIDAAESPRPPSAPHDSTAKALRCAESVRRRTRAPPRSAARRFGHREKARNPPAARPRPRQRLASQADALRSRLRGPLKLRRDAKRAYGTRPRVWA